MSNGDDQINTAYPIAEPEPSFGVVLRQRRHVAGVSLAELARRVHYSKGYLSKVENGRVRATPRLALLCEDALNARGELLSHYDADEEGGQRRRAADVSSLMIRSGLRLLLCLDNAHGRLRDVALAAPRRRARVASTALRESGVYPAREEVLASGSLALVATGESAFLRLIELHNAVRDGADPGSAAYHRAHHAFAAALWDYRMALRTELGQPVFVPRLLFGWGGQHHCASCAEASA